LHRRFGNWELAFAAYNMGYGGLLAAIRKYGTNDFWELGRLEAGLPLETALYVPKILAMAIVAKNCAVFGCDGVDLDSAVTFDKITVGAGVSLRVVANAAGADPEAVAALNPQYPIGRTPPLPAGSEGNAAHIVRVPAGTGPAAAKSVTTLAQREDKLDRHVVRWGESLEDIASASHTTRSSILSLNGFRTSEQVRPGTVLLVPAHAAGASRAEVPQVKPVVVVPAEKFVYPDRRRIFYRVVAGDSPREIASALSVSSGDLCRWNAIDTSAALHDGMILQAFVPKAAALSHALVTEEENARALAVGSQEFFEHFESLKGRKRIELVVAQGDNWRGLSRQYGLSLGMLERINHRSRSSALAAGDKVVVYVAAAKPALPKTAPPPSEPEPLEEKPDRPLPGVLADGDSAAPSDNGEPASPAPSSGDASEAPSRSGPAKEAGSTVLVKDAPSP
jgi:membrane-bound lytic murein transglycosylase D